MNRINEKFKLLILADDLTGSLDSGIQLVTRGLKVKVYTHPQKIQEDDIDVLVINTETRHVSSKKAYEIIFALSREAKEKEFTHFYKKTDSGLRGNIGSELEAILNGTMLEQIHFIPAYPKMNRVTKNGLHYVNDKLLSESIFANDPTNPINTSDIKEIINSQSNVNVSMNNEKGIILYDCDSDETLKNIAKKLEDNDDTKLCAGCAGFLEVYPINIHKDIGQQEKVMNSKLVVISGSANAITSLQLDEAERNGATRYHVPVEKIINVNWSNNEKEDFVKKALENNSSYPVIFDTNTVIEGTIKKEMTINISKAIGSIASVISKKYPNEMLMLIGGDALYSFINELKIDELEPYKEICPGTVLAKYTDNRTQKYLITKSGGFGDKDIIQTVMNDLKGEK